MHGAGGDAAGDGVSLSVQAVDVRLHGLEPLPQGGAGDAALFDQRDQLPLAVQDVGTLRQEAFPLRGQVPRRVVRGGGIGDQPGFQRATALQQRLQAFHGRLLPGLGRKVLGLAQALGLVGAAVVRVGVPLGLHRHPAHGGATGGAPGQVLQRIDPLRLADPVDVHRAVAGVQAGERGLEGRRIGEDADQAFLAHEAVDGLLAPAHLARRRHLGCGQITGDVCQGRALGGPGPDVADDGTVLRVRMETAHAVRIGADLAPGGQRAAHPGPLGHALPLPGPDPFGNRLALPLRHATHHVQHEPAHGIVRGDVLGDARQGHAVGFGQVDEEQQIPQAAGQAVDPPDHDARDIAGAQTVQGPGDPRPFQVLAGESGVGDHLGHRQAALGAVAAAGGFLGREAGALGGLLLGGDPAVDDPGLGRDRGLGQAGQVRRGRWTPARTGGDHGAGPAGGWDGDGGSGGGGAGGMTVSGGCGGSAGSGASAPAGVTAERIT
jgi:hypothetical protein